MTTATLTARNGYAFSPVYRGKKASFAEIRAALPDMPAEGAALANALTVAGRLALAAVPFVALSYLFIAV